MVAGVVASPVQAKLGIHHQGLLRPFDTLDAGLQMDRDCQWQPHSGFL
jgi:hypothetical protein